jgi:hypothetical protein
MPDSRFSVHVNFFGFNGMHLSIPSSTPTYEEGNVFSVIARKKGGSPRQFAAAFNHSINCS